MEASAAAARVWLHLRYLRVLPRRIFLLPVRVAQTRFAPGHCVLVHSAVCSQSCRSCLQELDELMWLACLVEIGAA